MPVVVCMPGKRRFWGKRRFGEPSFGEMPWYQTYNLVVTKEYICCIVLTYVSNLKRAGEPLWLSGKVMERENK
jgi:hypothetical protein